MQPCGEFGFRQRRIRKNKASLGWMWVRRAKHWTSFHASAGNPQTVNRLVQLIAGPDGEVVHVASPSCIGRAIAIAPTTATSNRIEIASNGNSPPLNRSLPTACTPPHG